MRHAWIWGLLLANVLFFVAMNWGGRLTEDTDELTAQSELHADKVRLLGESAAVTGSQQVPASMPAVAVSGVVEAQPAQRLSAELVQPPKAAACLYWGEFSGSALALANERLATLGLGAHLQTRTIEHASGFWVYMPPLKNAAEVQRKIGQLKKLGVNDHFVVQEAGEWQHAISLGVFRTQQAAESHLESLRKQGVRTAKVGERKSRLRFTQFVISGADAALETKIRAFMTDLPDSGLKMADCD
jgi:hypothetical protein